MSDVKENFQEAVFSLFEKMIEEHKDKKFQSPINAYLTGGVAINFYTNVRVSDDVDAILTESVPFPSGLVATWRDQDDNVKTLAYDDNYHPHFGLIAEDFEDRAILVKNIDDKVLIHLLHPMDLIITKLLRFSAGDEEDIRAIVNAFDIDKALLKEKVDYELPAAPMAEGYKKIIEYKLIDIFEWIDEKNEDKGSVQVSTEEEIDSVIKDNLSQEK